MKTLMYRIFFVSLFVLMKWLPGFSQQYPDSLRKYLEIAVKNNPAVQQKYTEYQVALQKVPQAGSLSDPELSTGVFLKPMELISGKQIADLRLMQMFPWFGVLRNAREEMKLMADAKSDLFRDAGLQVSFEVQSAWYKLYKIRKEISISEKNIELLKVIERLALVRFRTPSPGSSGAISTGAGMSSGFSRSGNDGGSAGMKNMSGGAGNSGNVSSVQSSNPGQPGSMESSSSYSGLADLYRIQIETGELQNSISDLKNQEKTITAQFNSLLNRSPVSDVFTGEILIPDSLGLPLTALPDSILSKNPMLNMLEAERESYSARKKMVKGMGYPMIGLGLNYSIIGKSVSTMGSPDMNGKDMIMPMVSVTLPIYRKKYNAMQKEAELLGTATSQNYQAAVNSLQAEYFKAVEEYRDAQRRIKLYDDQFTLASKSLELVLKSYSASVSALTDVLRLHQQTLDYELRKTEALADFNIAAAWLRRLMAFSQIQ